MPGHSFFPGNNAVDELARLGALLVPLQSLVVFLESTLVFSRTGGVLSHQKFFDTQVPSIFIEELVLPHHARCVFSRLRCNGYSLRLSSYHFRIGRIENPSCSASGNLLSDSTPSSNGLFGDSLSLYDF